VALVLLAQEDPWTRVLEVLVPVPGVRSRSRLVVLQHQPVAR
jgi:hypothetical protein